MSSEEDSVLKTFIYFFFSFQIFPDTEPPVVSCHATNITMLTSGQKPQKVDNLEQLAPKSCQDNSGHCTLLPSPYKEGSLFPLGDTIISHTAVDPSENNRTCSYVVSVIGKLCSMYVDLKTNNRRNMDVGSLHKVDADFRPGKMGRGWGRIIEIKYIMHAACSCRTISCFG